MQEEVILNNRVEEEVILGKVMVRVVEEDMVNISRLIFTLGSDQWTEMAVVRSVLWSSRPPSSTAT